MLFGFLLIFLDIIGTIGGLIIEGGFVYLGIANLIGKHFLLIMGIIIIFVFKKKKNKLEK